MVILQSRKLQHRELESHSQKRVDLGSNPDSLIPEHWAGVGTPWFLSSPKHSPGNRAHKTPVFALQILGLPRVLHWLLLSHSFLHLCHPLIGYQRHREDPDLNSPSRRKDAFTRSHKFTCFRHRQESYMNEARWVRDNREWWGLRQCGKFTLVDGCGRGEGESWARCGNFIFFFATWTVSKMEAQENAEGSFPNPHTPNIHYANITGSITFFLFFLLVHTWAQKQERIFPVLEIKKEIKVTAVKQKPIGMLGSLRLEF